MKRLLRISILFGFFAGLAFAEESPENDLQKGKEHYEKGEYDLAIDAFQRYLPQAPDPAPIYNLLGITYLKQNQSIESAIGSFKQAVKFDPNFAEAYFNLASAYASRDPALAAEYFQKTITVDPNYSKAYFGLGWFTLTEKQDPAKALELFDKTIERFPDFAEAYYGKGLAYVQLGKREMALEPISHLREIRREDLAALVELAVRGESVEELKLREEAEAKMAEAQKAEEEEKEKSEVEDQTTGEITISAKGKVIPL